MLPNPQFPVDLFTFAEEILMENCIFYALCIYQRLFGNDMIDL